MHSNLRPEKNATWPGASILIWGTFGATTTEGRRYQSRCTGALVVMIVGFFLSSGMPPNIALILKAVLPGATFSFICWEFWRYLAALDELARRIQLEAIAWTYLSGLAFTALLGGIILAYKIEPWFPNPMWFIVLEPIRGFWLYAISRRY